MKSIEHDEQKRLVEWWAEFSALHGLPVIALFAIPNGGERNVIVATRMKSEGVRRGVPDLFLALPKGCYHGLFIELKKPSGGKVSEHQKKYIKYLNSQNYFAIVCHGFNEAKQTICSYLSEKRTTLF